MSEVELVKKAEMISAIRYHESRRVRRKERWLDFLERDLARLLTIEKTLNN